MELRDERALGYFEEARLSLDSAKIIFDEAVRSRKELWAHVVKICYDAMEQAVSAAIAKKDELIPKDHPGKIAKFINLYGLRDGSRLVKVLFYWLTKRSNSQYVDIRDDKVVIPHKSFTEEDAELIIGDCGFVLGGVEELVFPKKCGVKK